MGRQTLVALSLLLASPAFSAATNAKQNFGEVKVKLDAKVAAKSAGIRTLYLILYNGESQMPMPYGAVKVDLDKDPTGEVYQGQLTSENVMMMSGGEMPKSFRIKARLDKDGSAGRDAPGDLVGVAEQVKPGSAVTIVIDQTI